MLNEYTQCRLQSTTSCNERDNTFDLALSASRCLVKTSNVADGLCFGSRVFKAGFSVSCWASWFLCRKDAGRRKGKEKDRDSEADRDEGSDAPCGHRAVAGEDCGVN